MSRLLRLLPLVAISALCAGDLFAQSVIVLKNGRQITVQGYREEDGMIKFSGFGGEIGISRDQIQAILKPGDAEGRGTNLLGSQPTPGGPSEAPPPEPGATSAPSPGGEQQPGSQAERSGEAKEAAKGKVLTPEEQLAEERAKEEREYQNKVREITDQLKAAKERYILASRGSGGEEPRIASTDEEIRARADLLISRQREAEQNRSSRSAVVDSPPTGHTEKQREVSELKDWITQLEGNRSRLIEEMKQKGFDSAGLFTE